MISLDVGELRARARSIANGLSSHQIGCEVVETDASVGGGSFPTARIPSVAIALSGNPEHVDARLRAAEPPVVSRILDGRALLDLRTVPAELDEELVGIVERALT